MSKEAELLIDQIERMNNFYMWSVGIFITLILGFIAFLTWSQLNVNKREREKLVNSYTKKLEEVLQVAEKNIEFEKNTIKLYNDFNYLRALSIPILDKRFDVVPLTSVMDNCLKLIKDIDDFLLQYNDDEFDIDFKKKLNSIYRKSLWLILELLKAISSEEDSIDTSDKNKIEEILKNNLQFINRTVYNCVFVDEEIFTNYKKIINKIGYLNT